MDKMRRRNLMINGRGVHKKNKNKKPKSKPKQKSIKLKMI